MMGYISIFMQMKLFENTLYADQGIQRSTRIINECPILKELRTANVKKLGVQDTRSTQWLQVKLTEGTCYVRV